MGKGRPQPILLLLEEQDGAEGLEDLGPTVSGTSRDGPEACRDGDRAVGGAEIDADVGQALNSWYGRWRIRGWIAGQK